MMMPKLVMTGFMATGKSVVSRALAARLAWPLVDCDQEIVARAGKPISEIFRADGEAHFRSLERDLIFDIASDPRRCPQCGAARPVVVALGGGAIVDQQNYEMLRRISIIVCLTARPEVIARRVGRGAKSRPMLTDSDKPLKERIAELLAARNSAYSRAAITVDTSDTTVDQVADAVISAFSALVRVRCRPSA
jgi:shikimate kinase